MITATWNSSSQTLITEGHADDTRVCASLSILLLTARRAYGAPERTRAIRRQSGPAIYPPDNTPYEWNLPPAAEPGHDTQQIAMNFVLAGLKQLALHYPAEIRYSELDVELGSTGKSSGSPLMGT